MTVADQSGKPTPTEPVKRGHRMEVLSSNPREMSAPLATGGASATQPSRRRKWPFPLAAALLVLGSLGIHLLDVHWPFRYRNIQPLLERVFASQITSRHYRLIYFPNPGFVADDLTLRRNSAPDLPPVGSAEYLRVEGRWTDLLFLRRRVRLVEVGGLHIVIPPVGSRENKEDFPPGSSSDFSGPSTVVETLAISKAELDIQRSSGGQYAFPINHLVIQNLRKGQAISYILDMGNAKPSGRIQARGSFGPVVPTNLGSTPVAGDFTFAPINLGDLHGISGNLSATGRFQGTIADIATTVSATTADFAVGHGRPTPVAVQARGVVNALNADVFVHSLDAHTGSTTVHAEGGVLGSPKVTNLDLVVDNGRAQDILRPFLHGDVPITGTVVLRSHAYLAPATRNQKFLERLRLDGRFNIPNEHLTNPSAERSLTAFSERVRLPHSPAAPDSSGAPDVISQLHGEVQVRNGIAYAHKLNFQVPGAAVNLNGTFNFHNRSAHLRGDLHMQSDVSHLATGFKSMLLKPFAPFFKKGNTAAVFPIAITGVPHAYKIQQNLLHNK